MALIDDIKKILLRVETYPPDLTTKEALMTPNEVDKNFIEIYKALKALIERANPDGAMQIDNSIVFIDAVKNPLFKISVVDGEMFFQYYATGEYFDGIKFDKTSFLFSKLIAETQKVHGYFYFQNQNIEIGIAQKDEYYQITNEQNNLFVTEEANQVSIEDDNIVFNEDEIENTYSHRKFNISLSAYGTNDKTYILRLFNVTQKKVVNNHIVFTTLGDTLIVNLAGIVYDKNADYGDTYRLEIANSIDDTNIFLTDCSIFCEVSHYVKKEL